MGGLLALFALFAFAVSSEAKTATSTAASPSKASTPGIDDVSTLVHQVERKVQVTYTTDISLETATNVVNRTGSQWQQFKTQTESYLEGRLPNNYDVTLGRCFFGNPDRRRALLYNGGPWKETRTFALVCHYDIQAPHDTPEDNASAFVLNLVSSLNEDDASETLVQSSNLSQFRIQGVQALQTEPMVSGAQRLGQAGLLSAVLGAALLLLLV